jgi:hypothetical protein
MSGLERKLSSPFFFGRFEAQGRTVLLRIWKSAPRAGAEIGTERGTPIPQRCGVRGRCGAVFSFVRIPGLSLHRVEAGAGDFRSWLGEPSCCGFGNPRPALARDRNGARNSDSAAVWSAGEGWSCLQARLNPRPVPSSCWGGCWGLPVLVGRSVLLRIWKSAPRCWRGDRDGARNSDSAAAVMRGRCGTTFPLRWNHQAAHPAG